MQNARSLSLAVILVLSIGCSFLTTVLSQNTTSLSIQSQGTILYASSPTPTPSPSRTPAPTLSPTPTPTHTPTSSTGFYRGMQSNYPNYASQSDMQTLVSHGCNIFEVVGLFYSDFLPSAVTSPNQVSPKSSALSNIDSWASLAQTYHIPVIFCFNWLNAGGGLSNEVPSWMLSLTSGNGDLLEYDIFTGASQTSSARTSITCLFQYLANRYAGNPYVCFDFFNEPFNNQAGINKYVTSSNYRTVEQAYVNYVGSLVDAVRSYNSNYKIFVDVPWTYWYLSGSTVPLDVPRDIIWEYHAYVTSSNSVSSWKNYINKAVQYYVTDLGKPLFIGEYAIYPDSQGIEGPNFSNWQSTYTTMINYMETLPIYGYSWWCCDSLYGHPAYQTWSSGGHTVFSQSDSTWILSNLLGTQ